MKTTPPYQQIIDEIRQEIKPLEDQGEVASYIPELQKVDPKHFGLFLYTVDHQEFKCGDYQVPFSIQSISKVFALSMGFSLLGEKLWERMGVEPSGNAFNSIVQLELEKGRPRNPLINSGAIVMSDILLSHLSSPEEDFLNFMRQLSGNPHIRYNEKVAKSEREKGFLNAAIANMLTYYGNIDNDIERLLSFYFHLCSLEMSCEDLSKAFIHFANHRENFSVGGFHLTSSQVKRINAIMQTCGLYDEAGEFSYRVGLPAKSGVGGGIAAICPQNYAVTVWSPRLNPKGNSVMGSKALELLTTKSEISIF